MSAIGGIIRFHGSLPPDELRLLVRALEPYGRDGQHTWSHENAGLTRTLSWVTRDDRFDQQPSVLPDGHTVFAFCGRLENRDELARALALDTAAAAAMADSAFAAAAYAKWGDQSFARLVGPFAIAVWDAAAHRLVLARDVLGRQPLHWHKNERFFAFASSPVALLAVPGVPRAVNEDRLADVLALLPWAGPESLLAGIEYVEPGVQVVLDGRTIHRKRFRTLEDRDPVVLRNDDEYVEAFREHFERAVATSLRSERPVAAQLSSGFDSSTVSAVAAGLLQRAGDSLLCLTATPRPGFDGPVPPGRHADEGDAAAKLAARHPNVNHQRVHGQASLLAVMQEGPRWSGLPAVNPCNMVWVDAIGDELRRRDIRVLLTGGLGNLTLSYDGMALLPGLLGRGRLLRLAREARALRRTKGRRWLGLTAATVGAFVPPALWRRVKPPSVADISTYSAINAALARRVDLAARAEAAGFDLSYRPWADGRALRLAVIRRTETGLRSLTAAAQHGVEERDPTMSLPFVEFCLNVPEEQFLRLGTDRWLLRRAYGHLLPREILESKTMGLQAADWYEQATAQRLEFLEEIERLEASPVASRCLDLPALRRACENWPTQGWGDPHVVSTYRLKLLRGLAVGVFIRQIESG